MNDKKKLSMQIGMMSVNSINTTQSDYKTTKDTNSWNNTIIEGPPHHNGKKYSLMAIIFIFGLIFVSTVKNETRNIQKEINNLQANINSIQFNLDQAILDNEVITSPENISFLAKEYLNTELKFYKRSQIKKLSKNDKNPIKVSSVNKVNSNKKIMEKFPKIVTSTISKEIESKKKGIKKLKKLYSQPKTIPKKAKTKISKKIIDAKSELKSFYKSPKEKIKEKVTSDKGKRWAVVQVVKVFLGMPIVPGR